MAEAPEPARRLVERFPALQRLIPGDRRRSVPFVQQTSNYDCGAACLAMVLAYHGKPVRLGEVRDVVGASRGASALELWKAGRWFGLRARGVQIEQVEDLHHLEKGSILHWQFDHFVVFERSTRRGAWLVDPARGRRHAGFDELRRAFTGVAVSFQPSESFSPAAERPHGLGRYLRQILEQSRLLWNLIAISLLVRLLALATPLLTGVVVDRVVPRGDHSLLTVLSVGLAGIVVFNFISSLLRAHLVLQLRTQLDAQLTLNFLDHLIELPYTFFQQRSAGDLMMRLGSNATIREMLTSSVLSGLLDGLLAGLYLVLLFIVSGPMGLLVLVLGAARILLFLATRKRYRELMTRSIQTQARSRNYQIQVLAGIETLKAMGAEQRAVDQWSNLFVDELNVSLIQGRLTALFDSLLGALGTASPFIILVFGTAQVLDGSYSLGTMLAVTALAAGFLGPLSTLVSTALQLQLTGSYLERIEDVLETPREQEPGTAVQAPPLQGRIALDRVSFQYGPASPAVVRDVSIDIAPGSFVALVGQSGAGKSTLASLLLGLYKPTTGRILYDCVDLETLDLKSVRGQLGIVSQRPYLFGASIRTNIALADPSLPLSRIVEAAKLAHIHDDIMALPMGYDHVLADGGVSLSGGQRQRIALARSLVHRPAILLLDEATSNLDAVTEAAIQKELARLRSTRIVIAHRLSTIMAADLILVMEGGLIVEQGDHDELMSRRGRYGDLVAAQMAREKSTATAPANRS